MHCLPSSQISTNNLSHKDSTAYGKFEFSTKNLFQVGFTPKVAPRAKNLNNKLEFCIVA
jgi:hypothetical protein